MDASHPIFQGPFPVAPTLFDMPVPEHYRNQPSGAHLGATMKAWRVHREEVTSAGYMGVVADGYGFEDSPDAEWIASGRNSKNARAAALARHGNFFHWGFAASPPEMTDEARLVFLNTLAYMRGFAGRKPLAVGEQRSREWLPVYLASDKPLADYYRKQLPEAWLTAAGDEPARLRALCEAELGYVYRQDGRWQVDADCKALALDNRNPASLRRCVELLAEAGHAAAARAMLERYTGRSFATAQEWLRWLDEAGDRLFHSDVVGRFAVAPAGYPKPHRAAQ
ncbi:MAG: hypothetical protein U1E73_10970 [Planctomycetota bacterium]